MDVYKTDSSTNIMPEQIRDLPTPDRDFQKLAFLAPGVERERGAFRFVTGGPVIGGGGNASQATILVDGVDFTDPALGLAKTKFSQDAISEFRVINNRFDAEVGGSAGGALSILTKSGHERRSPAPSSASTAAERCAPRARSSRTRPIDYERDQFGFTLGGPIVKDRTHLLRVVRADQLDDADRSSGRRAPSCRQAADVKRPVPPDASPTLGLDQTLAGYEPASRRRSSTSATGRTTSASAASRTSRTARS